MKIRRTINSMKIRRPLKSHSMKIRRPAYKLSAFHFIEIQKFHLFVIKPNLGTQTSDFHKGFTIRLFTKFLK